MNWLIGLAGALAGSALAGLAWRAARSAGWTGQRRYLQPYRPLRGTALAAPPAPGPADTDRHEAP